MQKTLRLQWPEFSEEIVIQDALKASEAFRRFYQAERAKIKTPLHWVRDIALPEGIDYRCTKLPTGEQVIRLRRIPALLEDDCKVAHEIMHLVLNAEGFTSLGATPKYETIASSISSMVLDVLVNLRLEKFGFDLLKDYETETELTKRQLEGESSSPIDKLTRVHWMVNYASHLLDWELVGNDKEDAFKGWFVSRYPDIAEKGNKLLGMVKRVGYDTPEKQNRLFREIIRRYGLESTVVL